MGDPVDDRIILFKYPSRGRPERFFEGLDSIYQNLYDRNNFIVQCTFDIDDETMQTDEVLYKLSTYEGTTFSFGVSKSKIDAVNRDIPKSGWDIICVMSDDMRWCSIGFDQVIRQNCTPDTLIHIPDDTAGSALATMYIADKEWYNRFLYVYHPSYCSLFCDNEIQDIAKMLGRYRFVDYPGLLQHQNPAYGQYTHLKDDMHTRQQALWNIDEANYLLRKANNFGL